MYFNSRRYALCFKKNVASTFLFVSVRNISSIRLSKYCELITKDKINGKVINYKLDIKRDKPLVVCMTWLMAKRKNILKYTNLYLEQGFDVLNVETSPWAVLWPAKGIQVIQLILSIK